MVHRYKSYFDYVALPGDRLDSIAYKFYGNPFMLRPIAEANPELLNVPFLATDLNSPIIPSGMLLKIPQIEVGIRYIDLDALPPWKRSSIEALQAEQAKRPTMPRIRGLGGS